VIELYEYSSLEIVLHLAIKVETQLKNKSEAKRNGNTMTTTLVVGRVKK